MNKSIFYVLLINLVLAIPGKSLAADNDDKQSGEVPYITRIEPEGMPSPPHFSYVVSAEATKTIYISGMTPSLDDDSVHKGDFESQVRNVYKKIDHALRSAGASPRHVVRQRVHIVNISPEHAPIMRKVMQEFYHGPGPASTAVGTSGLFFPDLLVEVDVTAVINE